MPVFSMEIKDTIKYVFLLTSFIFSSSLGSLVYGDSSPTEIVNEKMGFKSLQDDNYVFSIGEVKNNSDATLDEVIIEARYFDEKGELIDVTTEYLYSLSIPSGDSVAFKLQSLALADQTAYASQKIRVISSVEDSPCTQISEQRKSDKTSEVIKKLLISAFPILLIIAAMLLFMRFATGKNSVQNRSFNLVEQQNIILEKQGKAIDRIAEVVEKNTISKSSVDKQ